MFGSQVLDVAIGLIFIFLMLSLVVTAFNELVAAWLKLRSKMLWKGVLQLLANKQVAEAVYAHPLVASLSKSSKAKPSYIPSRTFVLALLDGLTEVGAAPPATLEEVKTVLANMDRKSPMVIALTVLMHDAAGNLEDFKKNLEQWFDNSMERVSGWYKRQTQYILLGMAIVITVWANADVVVLTNTLWHDPAVRTALVAQAQQYSDQQRKDAEPAAAAQAAGGPPPPPAQPPAEAPDVEAATAKFDKSVAQIQSLGIPLGWRDAADPSDKREAFPAAADIPATLGKHFLGWLLTALAISMGAPFWFDMLNKVISIRSAGKAPEEKQKSPKEVPVPAAPGKDAPAPPPGKPAQPGEK